MKNKYKQGLSPVATVVLIILVFISSCSKENNTSVKPAQDKKQVRVVKLNVDMLEEQRLQKASDNGFQPWRNNPIDVAHAALVNAGANVKLTDCKLLSEGKDEAKISASDKRGDYNVVCKRIVKTDGIWTATEVEVAESGDANIRLDTEDHSGHAGHEHK